MNIKVAAFTVSEKSIYIRVMEIKHLSSQQNSVIVKWNRKKMILWMAFVLFSDWQRTDDASSAICIYAAQLPPAALYAYAGWNAFKPPPIGLGCCQVCCWFIVYCCSNCGVFVFGPCFVMQYFVSFLVCQSPWCGWERERERERERESCTLYFNCLWCIVTVSVLWLFLTVLRVGLQCLIPNHTHCLMK